MLRSNYKFDASILKTELEDFERFLSSNEELSEKNQILPFFRSKPHLSSFIGSINGKMLHIDFCKFEFSGLPNYQPDIVVGDIQTSQFSFIELEDARVYSLFNKETDTGKSDWSTRFGHGFGQVVDWMKDLSDARNTKAFVDTYGNFQMRLELFLIIGRDKFINDSQRERLRWFAEHVTVQNCEVHIFTYDSLYASLKRKYDFSYGLMNVNEVSFDEDTKE